MKNETVATFVLIAAGLFSLPLIPASLSAQDEQRGEELFIANCAKCHGFEGEGFLELYPPIKNSRFLKDDVSQLPCIIRNGLKGELSVGQTTYDQIMPPMKRISAEQMRLMISHMQQAWNHPVTDIDVEKLLSECQ